jgi:hypothetical protein
VDGLTSCSLSYAVLPSDCKQTFNSTWRVEGSVEKLGTFEVTRLYRPTWIFFRFLGSFTPYQQSGLHGFLVVLNIFLQASPIAQSSQLLSSLIPSTCFSLIWRMEDDHSQCLLSDHRLPTNPPEARRLRGEVIESRTVLYKGTINKTCLLYEYAAFYNDPML